VMAYMDDFIIIGHSHWQALEHTTCTLGIRDQLGWQVNFEKSDLMPSQSKEFLGLLVDTTGPPSFKVPPHKSHLQRHNIDCLLCLFRQQGQVPVQKLGCSDWPGSGPDQGHPASQAPPPQRIPQHCPEGKQPCPTVHSYNPGPQGLAPRSVNMERPLGKSAAMQCSTQHRCLPHWMGGISGGNIELSNPYLSRLVAAKQATPHQCAQNHRGAQHPQVLPPTPPGQGSADTLQQHCNRGSPQPYGREEPTNEQCYACDAPAV